jgi:hypothetical protein
MGFETACTLSRYARFRACSSNSSSRSFCSRLAERRASSRITPANMFCDGDERSVFWLWRAKQGSAPLAPGSEFGERPKLTLRRKGRTLRKELWRYGTLYTCVMRESACCRLERGKEAHWQSSGEKGETARNDVVKGSTARKWRMEDVLQELRATWEALLSCRRAGELLLVGNEG